jgi:hypothetical protein
VGTTSSSHQLTLEDETVTKTYRFWSLGEHRREWAALELLDRHAPGLAPRPLTADLDAEPPSITMTRLPGRPLGGERLSPGETTALANSMRALHAAIPPDQLRAMAPRHLHADSFMTAVRELVSKAAYDGGAAGVVPALSLARAWLEQAVVESETPAHDRVFGLADGNLANCLWDGTRVMLVDFEDAGMSDRCFELADMLEHPSVFVGDLLDPDALLETFDLDEEQRTRVLHFRRVFSCFWLVRLLPDGPAHPRNPPGTLERHAIRTAALLAAH